MIMKRILFIIASTLCLASCLNSSSYTSSYPLDITFECSDAVYKKYFNTSDSTYVLSGQDIAFYWQDPAVVFGQKHADDTFQGGFIMSYLKGEADGKLTKEPSVNDTYRAFAASGASGSNCYVVFYDNPLPEMMPAEDLAFTYGDVGTCEMVACYVNNTTLVARKVKEHFQEGDKLTLKAKGYLNGAETGEVSINLAEYTAEKDSVMSKWSVFDMSKLGYIDHVEFSVTSTNSAVPGYACLDGIYTNIKVSY